MGQLRKLVASVLPTQRKRQLRSIAQGMRLAYIRRMRSYGYDQLLAALLKVGVEPGDVLIVHGGFSAENGFCDSPAKVVAALLEALGPEGTLMMPSTPYLTTTREYVRSGTTYSVRRSPSQMGILSEVLRRHRGAVRSLHPAHPIAAIGPLAAWFAAGHEQCARSCGPGSPYEKLVGKDAKVLFFDVSLSHMTFFHYLEHLVSPNLPFSLYDEEPGDVHVVDQQGIESTVTVFPFSEEATRRKRFDVLETELQKRRLVRELRVGNTELRLLRVRDAQETTLSMAERGIYFYELTGV